ncbi:holo-ACP synthase [Tanacetum coccineum]
MPTKMELTLEQTQQGVSYEVSYLEEKFSQHPLLPRDLEKRAINYQAANIVSTSIQPLQNLGVLNYIEEKVGPDAKLPWAQKHIGKGFPDQIQPQVGLKSFQFRKNTDGKPEVDWEYNNDWDPPRLHFNMSHTSSLIACGMTIDSPIGIDVEEKNRTMKNKILSFAKRHFTNEEVEVLRAISDLKVQRQEFNKLWTLKEAYIKALGRGFSGAPFNTFTLRFWTANPNHEVDLAGSHYAAIFTETSGGEYLCLKNSMLFTTGSNMSGLARRASLDAIYFSNPLEPLHQQLFWTLFIYKAFALFQDKEEMTAPSWEKRIAYNHGISKADQSLWMMLRLLCEPTLRIAMQSSIAWMSTQRDATFKLYNGCVKAHTFLQSNPRKVPPKTKASKKKSDSEATSKQKPPIVPTEKNGKKIGKLSRRLKKSQVKMIKMKIKMKMNEAQTESEDDGDDFIHPKLITHDDETTHEEKLRR